MENPSTAGESAEERITKALEFAQKYGMDDGSHHKMWVIDQMVRALTDCPIVTLRSKFPDAYGNYYDYEGPGESEEYRRFVAGSAWGEWDEGIAP